MSLIASFGSTPGDANYDNDFDHNSNNLIAFDDFIRFIANFGKKQP